MKLATKEQALEMIDAIRSAVDQSSESAGFEIVAQASTVEVPVPATSPEAGWIHRARGPETAYTVRIIDRAASERAVADTIREHDRRAAR